MFLLQNDVPKARQTLAPDTPKNARQPQNRLTIPGLCQACIANSCVSVFVYGRLHISTNHAIMLNFFFNACVHNNTDELYIVLMCAVNNIDQSRIVITSV